MRNVNFKHIILKDIKYKDWLDIARNPKGAIEDQARLQEPAMELSN